MHIKYIHLWGLTDLQVALEGNFLKFIPLQIHSNINVFIY